MECINQHVDTRTKRKNHYIKPCSHIYDCGLFYSKTSSADLLGEDEWMMVGIGGRLQAAELGWLLLQISSSFLL